MHKTWLKILYAKADLTVRITCLLIHWMVSILCTLQSRSERVRILLMKRIQAAKITLGNGLIYLKKMVARLWAILIPRPAQPYLLPKFLMQKYLPLGVGGWVREYLLMISILTFTKQFWI